MESILCPGVYPASVTPFALGGEVDLAGVTRLMAYFEASGCQGAVLAGTNGEGPSLSSFEKRDLLRAAASSRGGLKLILGIATPSLTEAEWLCSQAGKSGADAVLVMPPGYFRRASESGVVAWFEQLLDASPVPVIVYNYPKLTGITLNPGVIDRLGRHENMAGVKDSSGETGNLASYRAVLPEDKVLFVGDESILIEALEAGWSGTISGAANVIPGWLSRVVNEWSDGLLDEAKSSYEVVKPLIAAIRQGPQPEANKSVLKFLGLVQSDAPRLPLQAIDASNLAKMIEDRIGTNSNNLGLSV